MARIGIYGGSFNPPHVGHIHGAQYAIRALNLERLLLIPSNIAPHKDLPTNSPTPAQRAEMLAIAKGENMEVCDIELIRGGTSYTYETVETLAEQPGLAGCWPWCRSAAGPVGPGQERKGARLTVWL